MDEYYFMYGFNCFELIDVNKKRNQGVYYFKTGLQVKIDQGKDIWDILRHIKFI